MKTLKLLSLSILFLSLSACNTAFYQIYNVEYANNMESNGQSIVFENQDLRITYDFWEEGGSAGFKAYNKTDEILVIDKTRSFFILNGYANDYFQNEIYEQSTSFGFTNESVTSIERETVAIPPNTHKHIQAYSIVQGLLELCDQERYPWKSEIKSTRYSKAESPIIFSNRISYHPLESEKRKMFKNEFYVSSITNYPKNAITKMKDETRCGEKLDFSTIEVNTKVAPDRFYIFYSKRP